MGKITIKRKVKYRKSKVNNSNGRKRCKTCGKFI